MPFEVSLPSVLRFPISSNGLTLSSPTDLKFLVLLVHVLKNTMLVAPDYLVTNNVWYFHEQNMGERTHVIAKHGEMNAHPKSQT